MGFVSSWLLSITGVVMLSVLAELMLPEGQMNKYIKIIFSFAIVLAVISPLPKLFGMSFDFNRFFGAESSLQENYLYQVNIDKLNALSADLAEDVKEEGLLNVVISIDANVLTEKLEIRAIHVDLCDVEYAQKFGSKDITKAKAKIKDVFQNYSILKNVEVKFKE